MLQREISCRAFLHAFKAQFLFFPTENEYHTCREHAKTTEQIPSQRGSCLQHISSLEHPGMPGEDQGPVVSKVPHTQNTNWIFSSSSMQNHLLIADVYPPHLLGENHRVGFAGKEDENTRLLECFPRELLSVQPRMKLQGGHQNLLTYFFLQSNVKMQQLFPRGRQCCEHGWIFIPHWILPRPQSPTEREEYEFTHIGQCTSGVTKFPGKLSNKFCARYLLEEENINFKNLSKIFYLFIPAFIRKITFFWPISLRWAQICSKEWIAMTSLCLMMLFLHGFGAGRGNHTALGTGLATRSTCSPQNTFYIVKAQSQNSFQILLEFQVCKFISLLPLNSHSLCLGFWLIKKTVRLLFF